MDLLAHGLWTGVAYRRVKPVWLAVLFGMLPDLPWLVALGMNPWPLIMGRGLPPLETLPPALVTAGLVTHSFVVFAVLAGFVYLARPRWLVPFSGWALHIVFDIFSHADLYPFTGTRFLYPISGVSISVVNWNNSVFIGVNYTALAIVYAFLWGRRLGWIRGRSRHTLHGR